MKSLLKQIILDFHSIPIPESTIVRPIKWPIFSKNIRKANVFIGMRRSGKTYLMYQHMHQLLKEGINKEKLVYINFEDDRLLAFSVENFQDLLDAYFDLYPQHSNRTDVYFYFDEIHNVEHWNSFIRRLLDKEQMQLYITGSSAKMLSKEIATSLRGRCWTIEVFPLSLQEYLIFQQINCHHERLSSADLSKIRHYGERYLQYGGFPESLNLSKPDHRLLLQGYINTAVYRDVVERHKISNIHIVRLLMTHCLQNLAAPLSLNKVYNNFKSQGLTLTKNSLYEYVEHFKDAYLLCTVPLYTFSLRKQQVNPVKIYSIDPGVIDAFSMKPSSMTLGTALENAVFMALRRKTSALYYYKTHHDREIDFLVTHDDDTVSLYQVTLSLTTQQSTYDREVNALLEAAKELPVRHFYIITLNEEKQITQSDCTIEVLPYWKMLLTPDLTLIDEIKHIFTDNNFTIEQNQDIAPVCDIFAYSQSPLSFGHAIYMVQCQQNITGNTILLKDTGKTHELEQSGLLPLTAIPVHYLKELRSNKSKPLFYAEPNIFLENSVHISTSNDKKLLFKFRYCSINGEQDEIYYPIKQLLMAADKFKEKNHGLTIAYTGETDGAYMRIIPIIVTNSFITIHCNNQIVEKNPWAICAIPDILNNSENNPMNIEYVFIVNKYALNSFIHWGHE